MRPREAGRKVKTGRENGRPMMKMCKYLFVKELIVEMGCVQWV